MSDSSCVLTIRGGRPLQGVLEVPAAKNSVLPLLAASLLCRGTVTLENVPAIRDVEAAFGILRGLGSAPRLEQHRIVLPPAELSASLLAPQQMAAMRSGVFFLAPVLARTGSVAFSAPGGCNLGDRPVDIHLDGLVQMGAVCERRDGLTVLRAPHGLRGCLYRLRCPSVGATETLLMAAAAAQGDTRLENAALEPEVLDLVRFLNACGACITRLPGRRFAVRGTGPLQGCRFTPLPDRIWAGTLLCAAAGCGGCVTLHSTAPLQLTGLVPLLRRAGCQLTERENAITLHSDGRLRGIGTVSADPYPGFATDLAPLLAAALLRAVGQSTITDHVFPRRFACADGFAALGAPVHCSGPALVLQGKGCRMHGAALHAQDLRGGAALLLAALQAEGESRLGGLEYIARGYENLPQTLRTIGADLAVSCSE